jgi:hypothetical protein
MTNYTFTTTARQDAILDTIVQRYNDALLVVDPSAKTVTKDRYIKERLRDLMISYAGQIDGEEYDSVRDAYRDATESVKAQIKSALGV